MDLHDIGRGRGSVEAAIARIEVPVLAMGIDSDILYPDYQSCEIADLVRRGEAFIVTGDLAAARLLLQRAAEAGDARAALTLAGTYDPIVLEKLGLMGFASDIGKARSWYERAREFGSAEAPRRLEMLASRDH